MTHKNKIIACERCIKNNDIVMLRAVMGKEKYKEPLSTKSKPFKCARCGIYINSEERLFVAEVRICEKCKKGMRRIGPFATIKPEGELSQKASDIMQYECVNEHCEQYNQSIEININ